MSKVLNYVMNLMYSYFEHPHIILNVDSFSQTDQYITERITHVTTHKPSYIFYNQKIYKVQNCSLQASYLSKHTLDYVTVDLVNVDDSYDVLYNCIIKLNGFVCIPIFASTYTSIPINKF